MPGCQLDDQIAMTQRFGRRGRSPNCSGTLYEWPHKAGLLRRHVIELYGLGQNALVAVKRKRLKEEPLVDHIGKVFHWSDQDFIGANILHTLLEMHARLRNFQQPTTSGNSARADYEGFKRVPRNS